MSDCSHPLPTRGPFGRETELSVLVPWTRGTKFPRVLILPWLVQRKEQSCHFGSSPSRPIVIAKWPREPLFSRVSSSKLGLAPTGGLTPPYLEFRRPWLSWATASNPRRPGSLRGKLQPLTPFHLLAAAPFSGFPGLPVPLLWPSQRVVAGFRVIRIAKRTPPFANRAISP